MKKRIFTLLLALLMVFRMFPAQTFATDDTLPDQTELCTTCGNEVCSCNDAENADTEPDTGADNGVTAQSVNGSVCATCGQYDCGGNHCPTCGAVDCTKEHKTCDKCGTMDCPSDHANWCSECGVDDCGKEHCPTCGAVDCTREHKTCDKCGAEDCPSDHANWCAECGVDDCGKEHCPTCGAVDCTREHKTCDKCGTMDCTSDHANWCAECGVDDCGKEHCPTCGAVDCTREHKTCDKCGTMDCTSDHANWCADCKVDNCGKTHVFCETCQKNDCGVDHDATELTKAPADEIAEMDDGENTSPFHANIGRMARFDLTFTQFPVVSDPAGVTAGDLFSVDIAVSKDVIPADLMVKIVDCYVNEAEDIYWYQIEAAEGHTLPAEFSSPAWVFQDNVSASYGFSLILVEEEPEEKCPVCGETDCNTDHVKCDICGKYDCEIDHFWCEQCEAYNCDQEHLFCLACEEYDCVLTHTFCGYCNAYDCGKDHLGMNKPVETPVIPTAPTLSNGAAVSIVDEAGAPVTSDGLFLSQGMRTSLSAWSSMGGGSYQWQIRYDAANDLWADIQGQTGKGILVSPAMFLSVIEARGSVAIRCVVKSGDETKTSAAIPVSVVASGSPASLASSSGALPLADGENPDELDKSYVVVQYQYSDGRTAAASDFAELVPGSAYSHSYHLPEIPGYKATLNTHSFGAGAQIVDGSLVMNFAENVLTEDYTIFTVTYVPDYVDFTVIHYWQNVGDDYYTEHERETVSTKYKTGDKITEAHKAYPGFYNLLYETPTAAADGSTVIEVYYDRYYYLMKFELDGGYGVEPIYGRYEDAVEIQNPTRAGYEFAGWLDGNGNDITVPDRVPVGGGTYYAKWTSQETHYTVAYWIKDGEEKIYVGSKIVDAQSGDIVDGTDDLSIETNVCGLPEHSHTGCALTCPIKGHAHGDGYCVYNCGEIFHDHTSGCVYTDTLCTSHTRSCYNFTSGATIANNETTSGYGDYYGIYNGFAVYRAGNIGNRSYYVQIGEKYYRITGYGTGVNQNDLQYDLICHTTHDSSCCTVTYHDHSGCTCNVVAHTHTIDCYSCGAVAHTHSADCKSELANYVDFIEADQDVEVKGDGSSTVNAYYEYRTYTIRFVYARQNGSNYQIAILTEDGRLSSCTWANASTLPSAVNPSGKGLQTATIDGYTCYYISLSAKFGESIVDDWPDNNIGNVYASGGWSGSGTHYWGSWATAPGTGYRETYGDDHANIVGPYPTMSAEMIVDNPQKLDDGTYLAQNMIAWWGSDTGWGNAATIRPHAYHNYFELLPSEDKTNAVEYNGKYYRLVETYTFTAAHNSDTRVDPISFKGFKCVNDTRTDNNPNSDDQENSENYANGGKCEICGSGCSYCNTFYYDRNIHKLYFWNYNGHLTDGTGSDVPYGASLHLHGEYVNAEAMKNFYPKGLEPDAFEFEGWYTTAECHDGTEMNWNSTMNDADMTVYAKWVPISRTVRYYMSRDSLNNNEDIPAEMERRLQEAKDKADAEGSTAELPENADIYDEIFGPDTVQHGAYLEDVQDPNQIPDGFATVHPQAGYDFIGWFYLNNNGEETAFDPENMPVTQDLRLYAKWSANKLCRYNVYFALDENADGQPDKDTSGNIIYIAESVTGFGIAGRTYTFSAKGGEELDADYGEGYFPTVGSHSIVIDIADEQGAGANSFIFLYQEKPAVPYTVKYVDTATGESVLVNGSAMADKVVSDNKNVVVTENFVYIQGYMPDSYQKTLVVTADGENVITFYYTKDEQHALYVVNYYIEELNADLSHKGWTKYTSLQNTGDIGTTYTVDAITIHGFALNQSYTDGYNITQGINGMDGSALPSTPIGALTDGKISGKLSDKGMELNFYYTRNLYPYEFRYMLNGTTTKLAPAEVGMAGYDTIVTGVAKEIKMDLDGDGINEDYRLYDPTETTKDIHINTDGEPLTSGAAVSEGQATVNVATFYYVRCTQTMTVTKTVVDNSAESDPDPDQEFVFSLLIHAKNGYHRNSYDFTIKNADGTLGATGTLAPVISAPNTLQFTLKAGQTITIDGLPTAEYTVSEQDLPTGYYDTAGTNERNKLTVDGQLDLTVTNTYEPANLIISKVVDVEEDGTNTPEVENFVFTIAVPDSVSGSYDYTIGNTTGTAPIADGKMSITLKKGESATFLNLPVGAYTVTETDYSAFGYDSNYKVNGAGEYTEGESAAVTLSAGATETVEFMNKFPVGDLTIEKTVNKEFYGTAWNGDTFTFTVERTTANRPLVENNQYKVLLDGIEQTAKIVVDADGKLTVSIPFSKEDAAGLVSADSSVTHTAVIKNLPSGTYTVTEEMKTGYVQSNATVDGLTIPAETVTASFTNTVIRKTGNLYLEKELVAAPGYNPDALPEGTKFIFAIELLEGVPSEDKTFTVEYSSEQYTDGAATATSVTMTGGSFTVTLEADQNVTIIGLPEGEFRITEATIPSYANSFAHRENGNWVAQLITTTEEGQMFTEIRVTPEEIAEVKCTNTYPVDRAELIIQKLVTKEYDRDILPGGSFTFTVTLAEEDADSYDYKVYNQSGFLKEATATVTNKTFTVALEAGQYAVIPHMPVCGYTVKENADTSDYNANYEVYVSDTGDSASTTVITGTVNTSGRGTSVSRTFSAGKTDAVVFTNEYKRHLGTLTIRKTVTGTTEQDVFIFHIKGTDAGNSYIDMDMAITGSGSVTIYDLPLGSYTVTEDTSWSWRYTASAASQNADLKDDPDARVAFTNTHVDDRWLNITTNMPNVFGKKEDE